MEKVSDALIASTFQKVKDVDLDPLLKPMKESVSSQLENKYAS